MYSAADAAVRQALAVMAFPEPCVRLINQILPASGAMDSLPVIPEWLNGKSTADAEHGGASSSPSASTLARWHVSTLSC